MGHYFSTLTNRKLKKAPMRGPFYLYLSYDWQVPIPWQLLSVKVAPWGLVCSVATSIIRLRAQKFCYFWETNPLRVSWLQTG